MYVNICSILFVLPQKLFASNQNFPPGFAPFKTEKKINLFFMISKLFLR